MPEGHQVLSPFLGEIILGLAAQGEGSPQVCSGPSRSSDGKGRGWVSPPEPLTPQILKTERSHESRSLEASACKDLGHRVRRATQRGVRVG